MIVQAPDVRIERPEIPCAECDPTGRGRYCAPLRCYCGHPGCYAFESHVPVYRGEPVVT